MRKRSVIESRWVARYSILRGKYRKACDDTRDALATKMSKMRLDAPGYFEALWDDEWALRTLARVRREDRLTR